MKLNISFKLIRKIVKRYVSTSREYYTPDDIIGSNITLEDIHNQKKMILDIKDPKTSKSDKKQLKQTLLLALAKEKFPHYELVEVNHIQYYSKLSSEFRTFVSDFNILFTTAMRMPHKYFDQKITFRVWVDVLEGRERRAILNAKHNSEIAKLAQERKDALTRQKAELDNLLANAKIVSQIDNLTLECLPVDTINAIRLITDAEAQAKKLKEELIEFKAKQLALYATSPSDYQLPKPR
jgi:predicted ATP-dependent protease